MKRCLSTTLLLALLVPLSYAYRDLDTGTFLTRDPIGYADGPNIYCYVHCNPITSFDPLGLIVDASNLTAEDLRVLNELRMEDPVFDAQMKQLEAEDNPNVWTFNSGMEDSSRIDEMFDDDGNKLDKNNPDNAYQMDPSKTTYEKDYNPKCGEYTNEEGASTPGVGSGGTISWSASANKRTPDGEYDPKTVLAHETQHAADADAGTRDTTETASGVPVNEERAVRRQNDSLKKRQPNAPLRKTYDGKKVNDHDKPLPENIPEAERDDD